MTYEIKTLEEFGWKVSSTSEHYVVTNFGTFWAFQAPGGKFRWQDFRGGSYSCTSIEDGKAQCEAHWRGIMEKCLRKV